MPEQEEALLVLRMGGDMRWSVFVQCQATTIEIEPGKSRRVPVIEGAFEQLIFAKTTVPVSADGSNLAPGFGGWTDRGMTSAEPGRVVATIEGFSIGHTVLWGNGSTIGGGATIGGDHALSAQNKELFAVRVKRPADLQYARIEGTATIRPWPSASHTGGSPRPTTGGIPCGPRPGSGIGGPIVIDDPSSPTE